MQLASFDTSGSAQPGHERCPKCADSVATLIKIYFCLIEDAVTQSNSTNFDS